MCQTTGCEWVNIIVCFKYCPILNRTSKLPVRYVTREVLPYLRQLNSISLNKELQIFEPAEESTPLFTSLVQVHILNA